MTDKLKKRVKKTFKEFLKLENNRQNEIYYLEYALVEYEFGNIESCFNIINMAIKFNEKSDITAVMPSDSQKNWCYLHKQLVQLRIKTGTDVPAIVKILCKMTLQTDELELTEDVLLAAETKFTTITRQLLGKYVI